MKKIAFSLLSAVILVAMALPAGSGAVLAQPSSWPDDANWTYPTDCYFDPPEDEHPDWVDIVGNETIGPAAYYYFGTDYAFFRERVIGDPSGPGNFSQSVWLVLFDLPEPGNYEYLLSMDGKDEKVQLWNNTVQESLVWDPILKDEAEQLLQEYPAGAYARIVADGTGHWFVDWAFPLSVLGSYNITANTTIYFCTSADANNYNKDYLDCYEPDLAITEKSEACVSLVNKTYNVSYRVCNEGAAAPAGASNTTITIDDVDVLEDPVPELAAGVCYNSTVGPFTMSGANDTIMVCADNGDVVDESNETNNCMENIFVCELPVANFTANNTNPCVNASVQFTDLSTGTIDSWSWDFPGGSPSSASTQGPHTVTYSAAGNYTVNLTVSNACGSDTESKTNYIMVRAVIDRYNLTISSTSGGSVTTPGEGVYSYNASEVVDLVATADANYHFVNWTGDIGTMGDANSATTNITMSGDYSIMANFAIDRYNLSISSTSGGSVTTPGEGVYSYNASEVVDLVATPDANYHFVNWTGNVGTMGDANSATTNITMNGNYSIVANFAINRYNLTTSSTSGGNVTTPGEGVSTYDAGTVVDLVATADANYHFVNWTGDVGTIGDANSATTNISMNGNYSIVANFAIDGYNLSISSTSGGNVTTPGEGVSIYDAGTMVGLVATADANYHFVNWTADTGTIADVNAASTNITMNAHYSIVANFAINRYNLSISSTSGGNVTTPGEGVYSYNASEVVDLVATADANYHFVNWTGDIGTMGDANSATTNITMNGNYSIVANFAINRYNLTVNVTPSGGGNVTVNGATPPAYPNTTTWNCSENVTLDAVAAGWYRFVNWSGDLSGNTTPRNMTMYDNYTITANFINIATLEGNVTFEERGSNNTKWIEPFVVKGFEPGNLTNELWSENTTTNNTGFFTITGLTPGTYDIGIKNWTCLSEVVTNVTLTPSNTTVVDFSTIREGDITDDDYVDMGDYSAFSTAFNTFPGYDKWNANADLDRSGYIDMGDYSMFSTYFNELGDAWGQF